MNNSDIYIKQILRGTFSAITIRQLTDALHREGLLHPRLSVRFKVLFGDFDIVETDWLKGKTERAWFYPVIEFSNIIIDCIRATELYTSYFEAKKSFVKEN